MEITKVWALYYSATGTTDKAVNTIAEELAAQLTLPIERLSFTRPAERTGTHLFTAEDLVVVGSPTYAAGFPTRSHQISGAVFEGRALLQYPWCSLETAAMTTPWRSFGQSL